MSLTSLGAGEIGKSAFPMVPAPYSEEFMNVYNTMTTANPLHRRRYLTKNSAVQPDGLRELDQLKSGRYP